MTRKYKTSYKTHRNSSRFAVTFDFDVPTIGAQVQEVCTICGGKIEESPMMRGVCYSCYSSLVTSPETFAALKEQTEAKEKTEAKPDPAELDGTEPSPYILGGEIFYPAFVTAHDVEIPF